jgi:hypothetical protein
MLTEMVSASFGSVAARDIKELPLNHIFAEIMEYAQFETINCHFLLKETI